MGRVPCSPLEEEWPSVNTPHTRLEQRKINSGVFVCAEVSCRVCLLLPNLYFGDGWDDGGLGLNVGQVHGSGQQQQGWRDVFLQVQVQPLDRWRRGWVNATDIRSNVVYRWRTIKTCVYYL